VNVIELRTAHTADVDASTRSAIRRLMDAAFDGIRDDTFENVLGGVHALVVEDGELVGHGSVVQLGASIEGGRLYAARGWQLRRRPSSALTPDGIRRTADQDGAIYVLPTSVPVDLSGELICDWRHGALW
jgi:aminoglycoside 2'-N-acetyltransferase I